MRISGSAVRRLAIHCQGFDGAWQPAQGKQGVLQAIERLGYVQIDTISVIARAHHHTLWTRCPDYAPPMLHALQAEDRRVFEYWTHAASYVPMSHYRYYLPAMRARRESKRTQAWLAEHTELMQEVLQRIRQEGTLGSSDFATPEGFERGTWWSRTPAKRALEALFDIGELMVSERRNFQRRYDLRERVLPPDVDTSEPDRPQALRFFTRQALATLGVAAPQHILRARGRTKAFARSLAELVESGDVTGVEVEGLENRDCYCLTEHLALLAQPRPADGLHLLSPFDNLVISRQRLAEFFGFNYTLESYTPAEKRRYGYYCLPILWGERFVGRLDPKADRKRSTLLVRGLFLEDDVHADERFVGALASELQAMARFNGCERVLVERTEPEELRDPLVRALQVLV